jgi:3-oxoacyl-ACP reductase-like protein
MIKKYLSFALICLLLVTVNSSLISAQIATGKDASSVAKIKEKVAKRGTGKNKRVEVKMLNGTKVKGYISQSSEDSFTLMDSKTNQSSVIAYSDVAKVKNRLSKGDKIALGIVAGAAATGAVILLGFLRVYCNNEGC